MDNKIAKKDERGQKGVRTIFTAGTEKGLEQPP
jgi:hypothetical protein